MKPGSELFQLLLGFFVFGKNTLDYCPEFGGMVHFPDMRQLMGGDVIDDVRRCLDEFPVQPDFTL